MGDGCSTFANQVVVVRIDEICSSAGRTLECSVAVIQPSVNNITIIAFHFYTKLSTGCIQQARHSFYDQAEIEVMLSIIGIHFIKEDSIICILHLLELCRREISLLSL